MKNSPCSATNIDTEPLMTNDSADNDDQKVGPFLSAKR